MGCLYGDDINMVIEVLSIEYIFLVVKDFERKIFCENNEKRGGVPR